jgi:hypothetical protein
MVYNKTELRYVLQQLHRHRRETWQISQDEAKAKADKKRKGTNSRRSDVSNISCKVYRITDMSIQFHFIILLKKKERRKRGIEHMFNTNDDILISYRPDNLSDDEFKEDLELVIASGEYQSDEVSETDGERAQEEITRQIRPKNKRDTDLHVIRVYDKPWRSRRVSKIYVIYFVSNFSHIFLPL